MLLGNENFSGVFSCTETDLSRGKRCLTSVHMEVFKATD
jgi:hypothetical protein